MRFYLSVAWRNLFRQSRRTVITAAALAVGAAACMGMWAWVDGMMGQMFDLMVTQQLGHVQVHHPDYPTSRSLYDSLGGARDGLARIESLPDTSAATGRLVTYGLVGTHQMSVGARLVGVEPAHEDAVTGISGRIDAGRWLATGDARAGVAIPAVLGRDLAKKLEVGVGDDIVMITQAADGSMANELLAIVGIAATGNAAMDRAGVYTPLAEIQQVLALEDQVHEIVVLGKDPKATVELRRAVAGALGQAMPNPEGTSGGILVRTWAETDPVTSRMMGLTDGMMVVLLVVVLAATGSGVLNTMLMAVFERTRELGLLKALGLKPRQVVALILTEAALLGLLAATAGFVLGLAADAYVVFHGIDLAVSEGKGFEYEGVRFNPVIHGAFGWTGVGVTLATVIAVCLLASLWPAVRASRLRPVDAMRKA